LSPNPNDTVSCLSFSPTSQHLLSCGWDGLVACWEVDPNSCQSNNVGSQQTSSPLLKCSWGNDGVCYFGSTDNGGYIWNIGQNSVNKIAQHEKPISFIKFNQSFNVVTTASWDGTAKFWDGSSEQPQMSINVGEKVWAADMIDELAVFVVPTERPEQHPIKVYDLRNPGQEFRTVENPFDNGIKCIECYPDKSGYALGSIEGRVAIRYIDPQRDVKGPNRGCFTFKCHRQGTKVYPVNDLSFNPRGTFATAGGDGAYHFWDKDSRNRLKQFNNCYAPVTACSFNNEGTVFAYAIGYDWSLGINGKKNNIGTHIYLHKTPSSDITPK